MNQATFRLPIDYCMHFAMATAVAKQVSRYIQYRGKTIVIVFHTKYHGWNFQYGLTLLQTSHPQTTDKDGLWYRFDKTKHRQ